MSLPARLVRKIRRTLAGLSSPRVYSVQGIGEQKFRQLFSVTSESGEVDTDLLEHFSQRAAADWPPVPNVITDLRIDLSRMSDEEIIRRADAALEGELHPTGPRAVLNDQGVIDWSANPSDSREWLLKLHRHAWWPLWGAAYQRTGDERYPQAFVAQLLDWIDKNPLPKQKSEFLASWRLMETGLRMRISWITSFGCFFASPAFTDAAKLKMLRGIYDHAQFLNQFFTNRNHLVRESNGLVATGLCFAEFREARDWVERGLQRLDDELQAQVNTDGSHIEMSVGYQWLTIDEFEATRSLLDEYQCKLPSSNLNEALHRMYEFLAAVIRPDKTFPQLNDGFILWDAQRLADAGYLPESRSRSFPNAGVHVMRSDGTADASYLVADTGPYGGPHGHEDKLSFELFACGAPFIVDPGSYTYEKSDPYREYFVGSQGHNSVMVDQGSQVRRWNSKHLAPVSQDVIYGAWRSSDEFDFASGRYDEGYAPFSLTKLADTRIDNDVIHQRDFVFVKPDYWVIADYLDASNLHDYTFLFHLAPDVQVENLNDSTALLRSGRNGARLVLVALGNHDIGSQVIEGQESPIQGWYSKDHYEKCAAPVLSFNVAGARSAFVSWVLYPLQPGADASQVQTRISHDADAMRYVIDVQVGDRIESITILDDATLRASSDGVVKSTIIIERDGQEWSVDPGDAY